jgi:hypothetical protein
MSTENNNNAAAWGFESVFLTDHSGTKHNISALIYGFTYYEDIGKPFISANLTLIDSAINLISTGPISGGEEVEIKVQGPDEETYTYNFLVYRVGDRRIANKIQSYNLGLISGEALTNEGRRVSTTQSGKPHEIVQNILEEYLETEKDFTFDTSSNNMKVSPSGKSPFSLCAMMQDRALLSISNSSQTNDSNASGEFLSGSAGYFFFENHRGYNFRSIDSLCDVEGRFGNQQTDVKEFKDEPAEQMYDDTILSVQFLSEINLLEGLRLGAYASKAVFFNISTGKYEEFTYSAQRSWENQAHLGSQDELRPAQKELSDYPTRRISAIIDHETFYSGQKVASPEEGGGEDNDYWDWTKSVVCQSISRNYLLNTQGLKIEVPGNLDLCVGDKIRVILPNSVNSEDRGEEPIDLENSGYYLITKLSRFFDVSDRKVKSTLQLQRDSYGLLE